MADSDLLSSLKILKNSKILVNVDEVLQDILVVTYAFESKLFQGVLLDSTKRQLPCGIIGPQSFFDQMVSPKTENIDDDKFYNLSQRFTYFQDKKPPPNSNGLLSHMNLKRAIKTPARFKGTKMTVRLRPRQVLCSKCRSICNENSENVDHSSGRKRTPPFSENQCNNLESRDKSNEHGPSLIPRISRLKPNEINSAINGKIQNSDLDKTNLNLWIHSNKSNTESNVEESMQVDKDNIDTKMVLRKKSSVGSMEDLWDESVFEEKRPKTTPVIKISFGGQGEGEVVKIPSKIKTNSESEPEQDKHKVASAKAAKRALKKAKKDARRKKIGANTPNSSPLFVYDELDYRRHRHKVKHKKKHKEVRCKDNVADVKQQCLKQKLLINLKRVNSSSYDKIEDCGLSPATSHTSEEAVPEFPPSPLSLDQINLDTKVTSIQTSEGRLLAVGDIVWGKIHGFPWWPGKVLSISMIAGDVKFSQAHVAWYGSSTTSLMPCDQLSPFLETFKSRFNKKKKSGQYKEAIKQATSEASSSVQTDPSIPVTTATEPISALMLLNASPTQVHVVS